MLMYCVKLSGTSRCQTSFINIILEDHEELSQEENVL